MLYNGYSFDNTGIHRWPFKSLSLIRWENVENVISFREQRNLKTIIVFRRKHNKTEYLCLHLNYDPVFSYLSLFDWVKYRYFACLKIINENLPQSIVCSFTKELAGFTKYKPANNRIEELEHKALNAWLTLHSHNAYILSREILASDKHNRCALKVLGLYYYYDKDDARKAEQIFTQMIECKLYDPLAIMTLISIKLQLNEVNGLEFLFEKLRSNINYSDYNIELLFLKYCMDHDKTKAPEQYKHIKQLFASYCNSFWQQTLDEIAAEEIKD
jgi:hypothetical protein